MCVGMRLVLALILVSVATAFTAVQPKFSRSAALAQTPPDSTTPRGDGVGLELRRLQREVATLRHVVQGMAGALVYCDYIGLRER